MVTGEPETWLRVPTIVQGSDVPPPGSDAFTAIVRGVPVPHTPLIVPLQPPGVMVFTTTPLIVTFVPSNVTAYGVPLKVTVGQRMLEGAESAGVAVAECPCEKVP